MVLEVTAQLSPRSIVPISETLCGDKRDRLFDRVSVTRLRSVDQIVQFDRGKFANITWWVTAHSGTRIRLALSVITAVITEPGR